MFVSEPVTEMLPAAACTRAIRSIVLACAGILALLPGPRPALAAEAEPVVAPVPTLAQLADPAWIATGRSKFVQTCAYCHGQEGDSGKVRPFRERKAWDPQVIHDTIADGRQRGANVMPSWKASIPDELIWKIVAYIRSLEGKPRN
ncbi:MAG: c-type cytochrome [Rhodocyclaceae bacterium]|nr:c-type cytochrome [Rhodocyclaceae bacterium]